MERKTHQKETVLNILKSLRGHHPTAETMYAHVSKLLPSISRATVYRILNQFAEQGQISRLHVRESADRYDDWVAPHSHMLCSACRRLVDLPATNFKNVALPKKDIAGCKITGVEFTFLGICPDCSSK